MRNTMARTISSNGPRLVVAAITILSLSACAVVQDPSPYNAAARLEDARDARRAAESEAPQHTVAAAAVQQTARR